MHQTTGELVLQSTTEDCQEPQPISGIEISWVENLVPRAYYFFRPHVTSLPDPPVGHRLFALHPDAFGAPFAHWS